MFITRHWRRLLAAAAALTLIVASGYWAEQRELQSKTEALRQAAAANALGLRGIVEKHNFLPHAASRHPDVQQLLRMPRDALLRARVNDYFADLQATTGAAALYLVDRDGLTLAASNWNLPSSFVGQSYRQRPYFEDALQGRRGFFYGLGLTTGQSGLFIAEPVRAQGAVIGAVVVKISLEPLQAAWIRGADPVVLRDSRGIVFLSAVPEWLFHSIRPVSALDARWVADHGQYGKRNRFDALPWNIEPRQDTPGFVLRTELRGRRVRLLALDTPLPELGWTLTVTTDMKEVIQARQAALALSALATALLLLGVLYWRLREKRFLEQRTARLELEHRVEERTRDLQEAHAFRKAMEDSLLVGMRARDPEGKIIYVNPALCAMVGYSAEELLGRRPPYPYWHPDDLEKQARESDEALQGRAAPHGFESRLRHKDGHDVITMVYAAPLVDAQGVHRGWMSSVVDITAQKRAEARQRDQELRLQRSARLASVGEMASTLAHELNQPLMALSNFAVAARALAARASVPAGTEMLTGALDEIVGQSQRASEIVKRVRAFINPQRAHYEMLTMESVITHAQTLLKPELQGQGVTLRLRLEDAAAPVRGDRVLLEQVLANLIHNALHAMQDQADLAPAQRAIELSTRLAGQALRITVADQGPGIPADQLEQVFAPFFTTKPDGLGLGLNICRTIVEAHGGFMTVENRPGGGAAFSFTLPTVP
ncbi:histidine kinase [Massilia sp. WF1]|uniref:sensor histidine kinase n=1 Tax=unclassified Massilia TaxID=2609279 RepID=UPI00064B5149|nr:MULTISPECIES: ATP-binding protein [unclassified Massilia]ALK96875.1 PAS domain-containing sensor histidine kinase [Massilia sp. WG5]KLU38217.1 histidine kinase [Massilia sp. WF1]